MYNEKNCMHDSLHLKFNKIMLLITIILHWKPFEEKTYWETECVLYHIYFEVGHLTSYINVYEHDSSYAEGEI